MRQLLAAIVLAGGTMASYAGDIENGAFYPLSHAEVETMEAAVRQVVNDPLSAEFTGVQATRTSKGLLNVCGFVGAKNKGDVGATPFIGAMEPGGRFKLVLLGQGENKRAQVIELCQRGGIVL
ncbi:hypothetical protein FJ872_31640 [Mesorhizobium sp. B2-5-9]|uniref:hypothetical protein n=1 Tax=Mesorhizobium sp. B2-5-9 TaxID=2589921 RepID=UPI001169C6DA|nr:hypothetical protein [Mesorhizobium sp. B2-5-9]TPJ98288.1 hypothetical protein FJ872_31640 [Mesorhizobium sp. B2-5-9]